MIKQCSNPIIDFEFGDVQEILVELSKTKIIEEENPEEEPKDSVKEEEHYVSKNEDIEPSIQHDYLETEVDQPIPTEETNITNENSENLEKKENKSTLKINNAKKKSKKKKQSLKTISSQFEENLTNNHNNQEGNHKSN